MSSKFTVFVTVSLPWTLSTLLMEAFCKMLVTYAETICSMTNDSFTAQNCFLSALLTIYESRGLPESSLETQDYFLVPHSYNDWITWAISWCVFWFCLISLCSWSTKPAQLSKPIKFKSETRNLVTRVFPRLELFACFYLEFLSPPCDFFLLFWLAVISILILVFHTPLIRSVQSIWTFHLPAYLAFCSFL